MELNQSISIFMMPFFLKGDAPVFTPGADSIWKPAVVALDKGKIYPHIYKVLQSSSGEPDMGYRMYSLSDNALDIKTLLEQRLHISLSKKGEPSRDIYFRFGKAESGAKAEKFFSPKLLICPNSRIGMLVFSVMLETENQTMEDLMLLNYSIFKTYPQGSSQNEEIFMDCSNSDLASEEDLLSKCQEGTRDHAVRNKSVKHMRSILEVVNRLFGQRDSWNMLSLTQLLMKDVKEYDRPDPCRLHVFTYLQLDQDNHSPEVMTDYLRLLKVQNSKYQISMSDMNQMSYKTTFDNIYVGSTIEGGGIMTFLPQTETETEGNSFFRDFIHGSLSQIYLWIYIMVLMQRFTLIAMEGRLTEYDLTKENTKDNRRRLSDFVDVLTRNKVYTSFNDISSHTHHNLFYSLCRKNLSVEVISDSVERKTRALVEHLDKMIREEEIILAEAQNEISERREVSLQIITVVAAIIALFSIFADAFLILDADHLGLYCNDTAAWVRNLCVTGVVVGFGLLSWIAASYFLKKKK